MTDESYLRPSPFALRPLVGAHRGASARAPENTLAAFRAALEDGAEMIELDVHLTRDGYLAVIHDGETGRTTGVPGVVAELTMDELRRRDAGRRKGAPWAGEGIPELGDVLRLVGDRAILNVEVKGAVAAVPVVAHRLAEYGLTGSAVVSSFDREAVRAAAGLSLVTGLLADEALPNPVGAVQAVGATRLHMKYTLITADLAARLRAARLGLVAWTVNDLAAMRRLADLGVDAILSDDPRLLRETLR